MDGERKKVLFVDCDPSAILKSKKGVAGTDSRFELERVGRLSEGLDRISHDAIDAVVLSLRGPDKQRLTGLARVIEQAPAVPVVVLADVDDEELALEALRLGAEECLVRDQLQPAAFFRALRHAIERRRTLEESKTAWRQLVTALAHDINNPLVVINVNAQVLASQTEPRSETSRDLELLQLIQGNVRRIGHLIRGFLDISKSEAKKFDCVWESVQLNHVIREICHQQVGELALKKLSLELNLDGRLPEIRGDEAQLERALWNLVSNAVKYSSAGAAVTLSSYVADGKVCVSVQDRGMGIPQKDLPSIFEEFHRLKRAAHIQGIGLGLFIVRMIVEAHGGSVQVESTVGEGSTFTVCFPPFEASQSGLADAGKSGS